MSTRITPGQIKKTNRQQIYDFIWRNRKVSQQNISYELRLSRPTVTANLMEMEENGLICRNGLLDSDQIGRKAVAYSIVPTYRIAIGVEVMQDAVKIIAVDLYGQKIQRVVVEMQFHHQDAYYQTLCDHILRFIASLEVPEKNILGIGIAMQGLVSADSSTVVYGLILKCSGVRIESFTRYLPYPCSFIHDPDGAALSELWASPELTDAVYLSLSQHLGGSMISKRQIMTGKHGHTATFEHIILRPNGEPCYCGNRGCAETICSMSALLKGEDPEFFFQQARSGTPEYAKRWKTYLKNLARLICMLHLVQDVDFILGGHLAKYITPADIRSLYEEIRRMCPFTDNEDFLLISKMPSHNITIGCALLYIQNFLSDIGSGAPSES